MEQYIDIRKEIRNSESAFLKRLPGFIITLITKIIRQNEMNDLLNRFGHLKTYDFLDAMLKEMQIKIDVKGLENLPDKSKCFFVANHPFGVADGLILTYIVSGKYGEFRSIGNNVFLLIPPLRPIIAAINVFGTNGREYFKELDKVYHSELPITHFPAGIVSRVVNGKVMDDSWHKSMITKSVSCQRNIVPLFFDGKNSRLFYAIYRVRKFFGIKLNIELMLLPNEFFNKKGRTISVHIGHMIPYATFDKSKSQIEWAQWLKDKTYSLKSSI
ncbi:1-acyl-sn-glycerol-3-phosphate acyltransferase [Saccharicrinis sp. FJH54]|uniref:1-acyl-sn-glycerol-3-phosphate acyltransferase n=1 Tax=Saccharicrinis sp. FJH54 TaxID=3344665 RepID=UPI0035D4AC2A